MIKTRDELFKSSAPSSVITRQLGEDLYTSTRNRKLKALLDTGKKNVLISAELKSELSRSLSAKQSNMEKARVSRKGKGGRPRLPDPDPANLERLTGPELKRYKNRMWQREWRKNNSKEVNP